MFVCLSIFQTKNSTQEKLKTNKNGKAGSISKPNNLIQPTKKNKVNQSKISQPKVKHSNKFSKLRSRSPAPKALSASDLWRMNRSSHQFNKTMNKQGTRGGKGRRDRKGRQRRPRTKNVSNWVTR